MYICVVSRGYPTDVYKMNGIFEYDQAKALAEAGHKVVMAVVDLRSFRRKRKWGMEHFQRDGVEIYAINVPVGRIPASLRNRLGIRALRRLSKRIEQEQGHPDILHAHFTDIAYIASDWAGRRKIPFVVTEHASVMNQKEVSPSLIATAKKAYGCADCLIAVGSGLAESIRTKTGFRAKIVGNIVDTRQFAYVPQTKTDDLFRIVTAGNLIPRKGIDILVDCFALFHQKHPETSLTIIGQGPMRLALEQAITQKGITDCVFMKGFCSRDQMAADYRNSDLFILPSWCETFGVVYIEAMAAGLPVIATRCGGPEDFVTEENGLLVPVGDRDELIRAMDQMWEDCARYDRAAIAEDATSRFSAEAIARQLTDIYNKLV